ncbi:hypothetical protein K2X33_03520 [bacterium]|nr:hypothetical protein [bacterium]
MKRLFAIAALFLLAQAAQGELVRDPYLGVRPAGMGNAFIALSNDSNALWYNPAGLAREKGYHFNLIDTSIGVDSTDTLQRMFNAVWNGDYNNFLRTDQQYSRFNIRPTVTMPYLQFTFFNHFNAYIEMNNMQSLSANVDVYTFNDIGFAGAVGVPLGPYVSLGATGRAFQRSGIDTTLTAQDLLNGLGIPTPQALMAALYQNLSSRSGMGLGIAVDLGAMIRVPLPAGYPRWTLAATATDVGRTEFHQLGSANKPVGVPTVYNFGTAVEYGFDKNQQQLNFAFDFRHAFDNINVIQKLNLGIEYRYKFFAIRGGVTHGYLTGGFSLEFPPHTRLHLATYASEMGSGLWQKTQRWYLLQLVIGFNPN